MAFVEFKFEVGLFGGLQDDVFQCEGLVAEVLHTQVDAAYGYFFQDESTVIIGNRELFRAQHFHTGTDKQLFAGFVADDAADGLGGILGKTNKGI